MKRKIGFTLAEVMITIAVLGVLAAILIPAVMNTSPDQSKVMFKKSYYTLEKTVQAMINDDTYYPAEQIDAGTGKSLGFNYATISAGMNVPAGNNKFCYLFSQSVNTIGTVNCTALSSGTGTFSFQTADGIMWYFTKWDFPFDVNEDNDSLVVVDVNGSRVPNCGASVTGGADVACPSGKTQDRFKIGIRYDGKIRIFDAAGQDILANPTNNKK